nr:insulinase family protein [Vibrio sinus]
MLVSDGAARKSAAALTVNVGHFDDPNDREGLAHFVEHMLFLGTDKYPQSGEFQSYINQQGGTNNAWTGTEHSSFFFDVSANAFERSLDRFSQFFIAPLFNPESLEKERQAIESEYKLKLNDDSRRLYQVHKETINQAHPYAKFSVGNTETLSDRDGVSIRDEIVDFYFQQYSADLMTLTLVGNHSLDDLQSWAKEKFSAIQNHNLRGKKVNAPYVNSEHTGVVIHVEPIKEIRKLILTFPLDNFDQSYRTKPLSYFAHLVGYEGKGSLTAALKSKGWVTSLSAGGGASGSNYREFTVSCTLEPRGLNHINDIAQAIFDYIRMIVQQGMDQWRYQEKSAVLESAFRYQEAFRPIELASHLSVNMQHYDAEYFLYGDYMMEEYQQAQLIESAKYFVPDNLRMTVIAKDQDFDRTAKWYFTRYSIQKLSDESKSFFSQASHLNFSLPDKNPFIAYDFEPKAVEKITDHPEVIEDLPGFRLWHQQDDKFQVPKGVIYIAIDSPVAVANPRNIVKTRLCVEMFLDALSDDTYQAEIAGMGYNLYAHQGGVTLIISGFAQKQAELLTLILRRFSIRNFKENRFNLIKEQMLRRWSNAQKDRPVSQLFNAMTGILQPNNPPFHTLIRECESIDMAELPPFVDYILAELQVEMFVYGDWTKDGALELGNDLKDALRVANQKYEESFRPLVMLGKNGTFQHEVTCNQNDSAIVVYYQSEHIDPHNVALYSLANHLMSATFFHEIRTKQQLGYMVGTGNMPLNRHPGIVLYVQSPNAAPVDLIRSIDEFLNAFYMVLLELNEYEWHSSKRGLWNQISIPDKTLRSRAQRLWVAIGNKDSHFDYRDKVLEELKNLSRSDMIRFVVNELKPRTANRLVLHTQGQAHVDAEKLNIGNEIGSIEEFQLRPKDYDLG